MALGTKASERLERPLFGLQRVEWPDHESVELQLPYGEMIHLLRQSGIELKDLIELQVPAETDRTHTNVTHEWPSEEIWKVRKR